MGLWARISKTGTFVDINRYFCGHKDVKIEERVLQLSVCVGKIKSNGCFM